MSVDTFSDVTSLPEEESNLWMTGDMKEGCEPLPETIVHQASTPLGLDSLVIVGGFSMIKDENDEWRGYSKKLYR